MSAEKKQNGGEERRLSAPFSNLFPRHKEPVPSSASLPSISTAVSSSHTEAGGHEELLQDKLDPATKFAYADLLIAILRLDFLREGDRPSAEFCGTAVEIILKWANLPEKTNETLRHHMEDEGSVNDDFITLIDVIKNDEKLQKAGLPTLFGSLLIAVIEGGTYDSRFRVLLRHTSALLGVSWTKFEELEETLADRLLHDFVESDESRQTRERLAKSKRLKRYALIGAAGGLGAVLIGLTGGLAAPFVATGIGAITASTAFAGLATTTGAAIFGSIFGVAGGGLAGYRMKKRVGAIEEFVVESLTDSTHSSLRCVLCISGWIKENDKGAFKKPWRHLWMAKEQYTLRYESMYLAEWNSAMEYFVTAVVGYAIQRSLMETILAGVFSAIAWPMVLISSSSVIDNPWSVCFSRAVDVGEYLAEVILSRAHGKRPISLIGFSVGARVIYHCLLAMSKRKNSLGLIEDVVLLGAPVSASPQQWKQISSVVAGRVINGYCKTDWLLRFLYRTASVQFNIAGTGPVDNRHEKKIVNYNLSHIIKGHTEYLDKLADVLDAVGIRVTPLSKSSQNNLRKFEEEHAISDMPGDESREKDGQAKENVSDANEETENPERTREHRQRESCDRDGAAVSDAGADSHFDE